MTHLTYAPFTPFLTKRQLTLPGVSPMKMADWLHRDEAYGPQLAYRDKLIAEQRDIVFEALPEAAGPAGELFDLVLSQLDEAPDHKIRAGRLTRPDGVEVPLTGDHPLACLARMAQEDFLILWKPEDADEHILIGGILCFPSRWSLAEKMGRPLISIHSRVPNYDDRVAPRVQRLFDGLSVGRPLERANWLVHTIPDLFQPLTEEAKASRERERADIHYLRVERQTLLRLPHSGAVVFGVKTCVTPIANLTEAERAGLLAALEAAGDEMRVYHGGHAYHDAAAAALKATVGTGPDRLS